MKQTSVLGLVSILFISLGAIAFAKEAPMLAERVASGELPPVEARLPKNPYVVGPGSLYLEKDIDLEIGKYGGTLRLAGSSVGWDADVFVMQVETLLDNPGIGPSQTTPNILESIDVSPDATIFTLRLREGLKWSDGVPVTTEDVRFAYEDVMLNEKLTPSFPNQYRSGNKPDGEKMQLDIIDDYTQIKRYGGRRGHRDSRIGEKRWRFGIRSERGTVRGSEVRN